jgi:hypothetical protein
MSTVTYSILTCDAYKDRLVACQETWAKDKKLIVMGSDFIDEPDCYGNINLKYRKLFRDYTLETDWLFSADDDTYVMTDKLESKLSTYDASLPFAISHVNLHPANPGFRTGCGIAISRKAFEILQTAADLMQIVHPADATLYGCCKDAGIACIDASQVFLNRGATEHTMKKGSHCSMHYVSQSEMRRLHGD